jgi:hypothetical protein
MTLKDAGFVDVCYNSYCTVVVALTESQVKEETVVTNVLSRAT